MRRRPGDFLVAVDDVAYRGSTSGTSSERFTYFAGTEWNVLRLSCRQQKLSMWGIRHDTKIINVLSRLLPAGPNDITLGGRADKVFFRHLLSLLDRDSCVLRGYPSRLCELAVQWRHLPIENVIAVISTGECLYDYQRTLLAETFNAPVINEYGCHETGISGLSCPEMGQLHVDAIRCFYEVIDEQLVTTDLYNNVMPMIRYRCGDLVELDDRACVCGRPGPTIQVKGRRDDKIRTAHGGLCPAGAVRMPYVADVKVYGAIRSGDKIHILGTNGPDAPLDDLPPALASWAFDTFGPVSLSVGAYSDPGKCPKEYSSRFCSDVEWVEVLTSRPWFGGVSEGARPEGELSDVAELLHLLIRPSALANGAGTFPATWKLHDQILAKHPNADPIMEVTVARILLFGCCFDNPIHPDNDKFSAALARLLRAAGRSRARGAIIEATAAEVDIVIAAWLVAKSSIKLFLRSATAPCLPLDTLNAHHLLCAIEFALRREQGCQRSVAINRLRPLLAVLIGDACFFAPCFGAWLLKSWRPLLPAMPLPLASPQRPNYSFVKMWCELRRHMCCNSGQAKRALIRLKNNARYKGEIARCLIEEGYVSLITGERLEPARWTSIINDHAELLTDTMQYIDPLPWAPIMRRLAHTAFQAGQRHFAYQCLAASTAPSSRLSAFDRLTAAVNAKQSILYDPCA